LGKILFHRPPCLSWPVEARDDLTVGWIGEVKNGAVDLTDDISSPIVDEEGWCPILCVRV
jgi:hypothetical protein